MRTAILLFLMLVTGAMPVVADQATVHPQSNARLGALRGARPASPYARLFDTRQTLTNALQEKTASLVPAPKNTDLCGMTIIEAPPFFDQKMKVDPPKDADVRYTIRAVEPANCRNK